jgi:Gas vesicle synthesis protein GvpL/GvpF
MIELLAITDDAAPPPEPVRAVRSGGLSVLCTAAPTAAEPTVEDLWDREALLERLLEDRDLLPVRFGTVVADEDAAARVLDAHRDQLVAGLERVRGAVEVALRVRSREPTDAPAAAGAVSGREYLGGKAGDLRAATAVHETLAAEARESVLQPGRELLRAAYLVDRRAVDAFVARVRRLQDEHADLALVCTGPWPPFSFAEGGNGR